MVDNNSNKESYFNQQHYADDLRNRQRKNRREAPFWQLLSLILHGVGFILLVIFTPLREIIVPEKKEPESQLAQMSSDQIERMSEKALEARKNEIARYLAELQSILYNMEYMENEMLKDYDAFTENETKAAAETIDDMFENVIKNLDTSITTQASAVESLKQNNVKRDQSIDKNELINEYINEQLSTLSTLDKIRNTQSVSQSVLDTISSKAELFGMEETAKATEIVHKAQVKVNEMQEQLISTHRSNVNGTYQYRDLKAGRIVNNQERINKTKIDAENLEKNIAELQKSLQESKAINSELSNKVTALKEEVKKARSEENSIREQIRKAHRENKKELASTLDQQLKVAIDTHTAKKSALWQAEQEKNKSDSKVRQVTTDINRRSNQLVKTKASIENLSNSQNKMIEEAKNLKTKIIDATKNLSKIENDIKEEQQKVLEQVKIVAELAKKEEAKVKKIAKENPEFSYEVFRDLSTVDISEAYETARAMEQKVFEKYRDVKATQLAISQKMPLKEAQNLTDVAKTIRPDVQKEILLSNPRTESQFLEKKEAMTTVVREAENMVEVCEGLMKQSMELAQLELESDGKTFKKAENRIARLSQLYALSEMNQQLTEAAAEDENNRVKDMAELMVKAEKYVAEAAETKQDPEKKNINLSSETKSNNALNAPKIDSKLEGLIPGNIIASSGIPAEWMYVNSWYVIGPFENPNRINLRRKFPPESVIDLDATYVGKNGRTIKWEYEQATASRHAKGIIIPSSSEEYGIWYAYTEVFVEEECDMWVAIGSDDRSDIWLNDFHVWGSSNELKAWRIDEGYRKVHFKKGRNKILARVENGWHAFGWSFCIAPIRD